MNTIKAPLFSTRPYERPEFAPRSTSCGVSAPRLVGEPGETAGARTLLLDVARRRLDALADTLLRQLPHGRMRGLRHPRKALGRAQ
jgi:hypothetical protein